MDNQEKDFLDDVDTVHDDPLRGTSHPLREIDTSLENPKNNKRTKITTSSKYKG